MLPDSAWALPLVLLPGVALLIMSTSIRYNHIHSEVHHLIEHTRTIPEALAADLHKRARWFRNALVALYSSVGAFTLGSIVGALVDFMNWPADAIVLVFLVIGVGALQYAAILLVRESILSLEIFEEHFERLMVHEGHMADGFERAH